MATALRERDWSRSSLGAIANWPHALRAAVTLVLESPVPMWLAWGDDLCMVYNDSYVPLLGGKHPHAFGASVRDVWREVWPDNGHLVDAALAGQAVFREDVAMTANRNGYAEQVWFSFSFVPVRNESGTVRGLLCTVVETTDKMRMQQKLAASEARLHALTRATTNVIYRMSGDWSRMLELNGQGFIANTDAPDAAWADNYIHPEDRAQVDAAIRDAIARRGTFELEHRVIRADGTLGWTLSRAIPVFDDKGDIVEWFGTAADVTARRQAQSTLEAANRTLEQRVKEARAEQQRLSDAENALRESERKFRALFESMDEGFCIIEFLDGPHGPLSDYVHVAANPAYTANAGIPDVVGQRVREMVPNEADGWVEIYRRVLVTGEPVRFERELLKTGRHLELAAFRIDPIERRQVAVLFQDVTKRRRAELALRELNETLERRVAQEVAERTKTAEALRQSQKMEAVGQLTGGIAHDFNNMLAVIMNSLELLDRKFLASDPLAKRFIEVAKNGGRRAAQLTQRLLAFSRQQPLKPEPIDANKLVAGMSDLLAHSLGGAVRLETVQAAGLWRTLADPNQLENSILNLAVNGRDAMPDGGRLTIETANCHLDERYAIEHDGVAAGQYVLIAVTDTGSGMPPDVVAKAFDPFFTTKPVGRGSGLGLSQVYGFVRQSGGHVKIYSEVGVGTTVKIYLPRLIGGGSLGTTGTEEAADSVPQGLHELILVVEDETDVRQLAVESLRELGYRVLEADSAEAALKLLDAHPEIELMFTDVVMPDVNGRRLADEARRRRPSLKVLFTTGYTRNAVVHNGTLDAGVQLIGKPYSLDELAARVRAVLDSPA